MRLLKKQSGENIFEDITKISQKPLGSEIDELLVQTMGLLDGKIVSIQQHITERKQKPQSTSVDQLQEVLNERNNAIKRNLKRILDMQSAPIALWMKPFSQINNGILSQDDSSNTTYNSTSLTPIKYGYFNEIEGDYGYQDQMYIDPQAEFHQGIAEHVEAAQNHLNNQAYYYDNHMDAEFYQQPQQLEQQQQQQQIWQDNNHQMNGEEYGDGCGEEEVEEEFSNEQIGAMNQNLGRSEEECQERLNIYRQFELEHGIEVPKFFKCSFYLRKTPRQRFFQYMRDQEFKGVARLYEILKTQQRVAEFLDTSVPNVKRILTKVMAVIPSARRRG